MDCEAGPENTRSGSGISTNMFLHFAYLGMSLFLNNSFFFLDIENLAIRSFPLSIFNIIQYLIVSLLKLRWQTLVVLFIPSI